MEAYFVIFQTWCFPLSIMPLGCIPDVVCSNSLFLFITEWRPLVLDYQFAWSFIYWGPFWLFLLLPVTNRSAVNRFLYRCEFLFLQDKRSRVQLLFCMVNVEFFVFNLPNCLPEWPLYHFTSPPATYERFSFSPSSPALGTVTNFFSLDYLIGIQ